MQLVFIHGSGGCRESFQSQVSHFAGSEAINLPGHPDGDLIPSIEQNAAWLHGYVTEKGYQDLVIVGHSLGGGIALQYALDYGNELEGIILLGSGARLRVHPDFLENLRKEIQNPSTAPAPRPTNELIEPELAALIERRRAENGAIAALNDMEACDRFDVMERLDEISLPVLAIVGTDDVMTPPKYSQFMAERMSDASAVIIEGGTHMAYAEKPSEVNAAIDRFLTRIA